MPKRRLNRGYPLAVLIGLGKREASLWNIYSQSIKPDTAIKRESTEYNFYEAIINRIRPSVKQGVKTILVASRDVKDYQRFLTHLEKHQKWLVSGYELNRATLKYIEGSAETLEEVVSLVEEAGLKKTVLQASREDLKRVMSVLEKRLGTPEGIDSLLFSLDEIEEAVYGDSQAEYLLLTVSFHRQHRRRCQRLLQIAENKGIKTMIVEDEPPMGSRLTQFGGLICMNNRLEE